MTVLPFSDTPLATKSEERIAQITGLPPKPAQKAQWLVDLLPASDKVKPLLAATKAERERWERRVALLKADRIDPDMLDERARFLLNYADPRDVIVMIKQR